MGPSLIAVMCLHPWMNLFPCNEEGCVKSYQRWSALQKHLECGKHERESEHATLMDKAAAGYSKRLEKQCLSIFVMSKVNRQYKFNMNSFELGNLIIETLKTYVFRPYSHLTFVSICIQSS